MTKIKVTLAIIDLFQPGILKDKTMDNKLKYFLNDDK